MTYWPILTFCYPGQNMEASLCVEVNRIDYSSKSIFVVGIAFDCLLGSKPKWTDNGCVTVAYGDNITCQCSHLTFFAILLVCFTLFTIFFGHNCLSFTSLEQTQQLNGLRPVKINGLWLLSPSDSSQWNHLQLRPEKAHGHYSSGLRSVHVVSCCSPLHALHFEVNAT